MAIKTILNTMKKWAVVFVVMAFAVSAFLVIQHAQAYYGDYSDDYYGDYYGDYSDDYYDDYYGDYSDDYYDDYYGDYSDDYYDDYYGDYSDDYYGDYYEDSYYEDYYEECYDCYDDYYYDDYDTCYDCYDDYDTCYDCNQPIDVCPNISGNQTSIPSGLVKDSHGNCVQPTPDLNVTCEVSNNNIQTGESVTYSASVSGGTGSYTYSWSGTNSLSGYSRTVSKQYTSSGNKSATVTVHSGNQTDTATCNVVVEEEPQEDLNITCEADPNSAQIGETVQFTATATGGTGSYTYSWTGTSALSGTSRIVSKQYSTTGTKTATVRVRSGDQTNTATCTTVVEEEPQEDLNVTCNANPNSAETGETVQFTATAIGGTGSYSYSWTGTNSLSGTSRTVSKQYSTTGTKTATITVHSGEQTDTATCNVVVEEEPQENLNVTCEANRSSVRTGETVTYTASATGGTGSYTATWTGTDNLSGTSRTVSKQYSTTGTKTATVTVLSGNQTDTATCNVVVEEEDADLNVVCEVSDTRVEKGENVRYRAIATGGTGSYTYDWNGSSPLDGENDRTVDVDYNSTGSKRASVTVRSGGVTRTDECSTVVVEDDEEDEDTNFDVSCSASPRTVYVNEEVTWSADVSGISGTKHYDWSGTDGLDGSRSEVDQSYDTPGTKKAKVTVTVNGHKESDECTIKVLGSSATVYQIPTQPTTPTLSSVYLSQVPYTGPETLKYIGYILSLLVVSLAGAFYVIKRKSKLSRKDVIDAFKRANMLRKGTN